MTKLNAELWRRAHRAFLTALELQPEQRSTFLYALRSDNVQLGDLVEELLERDQSHSNSLETPVDRLFTKDDDELDTPGDQLIGPFRLLRKIGSGGTSTVYLGAPVDPEAPERVAVKVLREDLDSEIMGYRFQREREILARLRHPHIARLLQGGTSDSGRPFVATEFVEGTPLTTYCDDHQLPIHRRLELFREICGAVSYAHQNLVVHRDLKPGNILVTEEGHSKLVDFGISKLLDGPASGNPAHETRTRERLLTPGYASPEQLAGLPVTTSTDIYSLGVVLYELLTGHLPETWTWEARDGRAAALSFRPPLAPSRLLSSLPAASVEDVASLRDTTPERLQRRISGDLDRILDRALRQERVERYPSVEQFSDDLQRFLDGMPVTAHPSSLPYRLTKFVGRHRTAVTASGIAVFALLFALVTTMAQAKRFAQQRDVAQKAERLATETTHYLVESFSAAGEGREFAAPPSSPREPVSAQEILHRGVARLEQFSAEPELRASFALTLAMAYHRLGFDATAIPLLESAIELRRQVFGEEHIAVAEGLYHYGLLRLEGKDFAPAARLLKEAWRLRQSHLGLRNLDTADAAYGLARAWLGDERTEEAVNVLRSTLATRNELLGAHHPEVATTRTLLAQALLQANHPATARKELEQAITDLRAAGATESLTLALMSLAKLSVSQGNPATARDLLAEALDLNLGDPQASPRATQNLFEELREIARLLSDSEAEQRLIEELQRWQPSAEETLSQPSEGSSKSLAAQASDLAEQGRILSVQGRPEASEPLLREALAMRQEAAREAQRLVGDDLQELATALLSKGQVVEAEGVAGMAVQVFSRVLGPEHWRTASAQGLLGACALQKGRMQRARDLLMDSLAILEAHPATARKDLELARRRIEQLQKAEGRNSIRAKK